MEITREQAHDDLERVLKHFDVIGSGSEMDRAAQMVMQAIGVLERRVGDPTIVEMVYVDNAETAQMLPSSVYGIAQAYVDGSIDEKQAKKRLEGVSSAYLSAFKEMGVAPAKIDHLFSKP